MQALELYKGDFLPDSGGLMWVMPFVRYYRSVYVRCVYAALELLTELGRAAEAEMLCIKAMHIDSFDEHILEHYLRALLSQRKNAEALEEYQRFEGLFYDELGVKFSENLREVHNMIQRQNITEELSIDEMMNSWLDSIDFPGAYYCETGIFKILYQTEARSLSRSGKTVYILGFEVKLKNETDAKGRCVMQELSQSIAESLRKGDIFTRPSPSQYMIMLRSLTYENCVALSSKILSKLKTKKQEKNIKVTIRAIKPIE